MHVKLTLPIFKRAKIIINLNSIYRYIALKELKSCTYTGITAFCAFGLVYTYNCSDRVVIGVLNEQQNPLSVFLTEKKSAQSTMSPCHIHISIIS